MRDDIRALAPLLIIAGGLIFLALFSAVVGCGALDPICDLPEPEVAGTEAYIIDGEPSVDRRGTVLLQSEDGYFCTGTVVGPYTVLTAAHCVTPHAPVRVRIDVDGERWYFVAKDYVIHPDYKNKKLRRDAYSDVALVYVTAQLPEPYVRIGQKGTFACYVGFIAQGYGRGSGGVLSERLIYEVRSTKNYIYVTEGPCFGDSGSSLYIRTPDGELVTVGVSSRVRNSDCSPARRGIAAIYTNLQGRLGNWARNNIR